MIRNEGVRICRVNRYGFDYWLVTGVAIRGIDHIIKKTNMKVKKVTVPATPTQMKIK